jgi:hypothetical protein
MADRIRQKENRFFFTKSAGQQSWMNLNLNIVDPKLFFPDSDPALTLIPDLGFY